MIFVVKGTPAPQGSKRAFVNQSTGRAAIVEDNKARVRSWREIVREGFLTPEPPEMLLGPVAVRLMFYMPRPKSHYRTGAHSGDLKPNAPMYVATKPDIDKLARSTLDALSQAGAWRDDSQVASLLCLQRYVDHAFPVPGAEISLWSLDLDGAPA